MHAIGFTGIYCRAVSLPLSSAERVTALVSTSLFAICNGLAQPAACNSASDTEWRSIGSIAKREVVLNLGATPAEGTEGTALHKSSLEPRDLEQIVEMEPAF